MTSLFPLQDSAALGGGLRSLSIRGAAKRYGNEAALNGVTLSVGEGSVVGLVGRNGAGKTTLMKAVLGAVVLDGGEVELFGENVKASSSQELVRLRQRVAYVSSTVAYPTAMTVEQVRRLYELAYPAFDSAEFGRICQVLALDAPQRKVSELSRGMGMKLQLACTLSCGADLLLLDEPTAGLDPIVREELLDVLRAWMETDSRSMLISSHITTDLGRIADYLVMLESGSVVFSCERDVVDERMGVAHLRQDQLQQVVDSWPFAPTEVRVIGSGLSWSVLVPDRAAFMRAFPSMVCDRATIDEVMAFMVKGEVR